MKPVKKDIKMNSSVKTSKIERRYNNLYWQYNFHGALEIIISIKIKINLEIPKWIAINMFLQPFCYKYHENPIVFIFFCKLILYVLLEIYKIFKKYINISDLKLISYSKVLVFRLHYQIPINCEVLFTLPK